ncbi:MAG: hypothetical protein AAF439_08935 [Pseudomonadota bacterium]
MEDRERDTPEQDETGITIPARLVPAEAGVVRDRALVALQGASGEVDIDINGGNITPCCLQIAVGSFRSARRRGLEPKLSRNAHQMLLAAGVTDSDARG